MIAALFAKLFEIIIGLINTLLTPIDLIIQSALPNLADLLGYVNTMINIGISGLGWAVSLSMLNPALISVLYLYVTFILTIPMALQSIKLVVRWYNALKP